MGNKHSISREEPFKLENTNRDLVRKDKALSDTHSTPTPSSKSRDHEPQLTDTIKSHDQQTVSSDLTQYKWFHGNITTAEAEFTLSCCVDESFLIRESDPGEYWVSLRSGGRVEHHKIFKDCDSMYYVHSYSKFHGIDELVNDLYGIHSHPVPNLHNPRIESTSHMVDKWELDRSDIHLLHLIFDGNFGKIYQAVIKSKNMTVAVKTYTEYEVNAQDFLREADLLKQLEHKNIISLIGVCTRERPLYIITEYLSKGSMMMYLYLRRSETKKIEPVAFVYMAQQIASAMTYLHTKHIIHRTLAVNNCLVGEHYLVKVAHFSEYQIAHSFITTTIPWSRSFAPEALVLNSNILHSVKSDVWAYGILLWDMTTYCMSAPYEGIGIHQLYQHLESGFRLQRPEDCPEALYDIMNQCWAWDPQDRPSFSEILDMLSSLSGISESGTKVSREHASLLGQILHSFSLDDPRVNIQELIKGNCDLSYEDLEFILSQHPSTISIAQNLQRELKSRVEEEQLYEKAIENDDPVVLLYLRILGIGPGQVGKSTFFGRLMGLMQWDINTAPLESQPQGSTGQAELNEMYIHYCHNSLAITENSWHLFEKDREVEKQIVALTQLLTEQVADIEDVDGKPSLANEDGETTLEHKASSSATVLNSLELIADTTQSAHEERHDLTQYPGKATDGTNHDTIIPSIPSAKISHVLAKFEELRRQLKLNPNSSQLELIDAIINLVDVGGQPAFLDMLPLLTMGPAIYLVFMKLLQGLKTPYPVKFKHEGDAEATVCREYSYTSEEVIFTALSSIACFGHSDEEVEKYVHKDKRAAARKTNSLALLVGTHADEIDSLDSEKRESAVNELQCDEQKLRVQLEKTDFLEHGIIEYCSPKGELLFKVNNKSGGKEEIDKYRQLFEELMRNRFRKYTIPAKWMKFSICLRILANQEGMYRVAFDDCIEIGKSIGMTEQMVSAALRFLHKYIGLVMYFPENEKLKHIVICDPRVVFKSISELIFNIYDPKRRYIPISKCNHFIETGCFSKEDIRAAEKDNLLSIDDLVELMVFLNIAAPLHSSKLTQEYFLPAVLQSAKDIPVPNTALPEPLCVYFRTGYIPLGFVSALITRLITDDNFELLGQRQGCTIFKNAISFRLKGRYNVTLVSWPKFCEVRIEGLHSQIGENFETCCPLIRDTLCNAIESAIVSMRQKSLFRSSQTYSLAFRCPLSNSHQAPVDHGHDSLAVFTLQSPRDIICNDCKITSQLTPRMSVWLAPRVSKQLIGHETYITIKEKITLSVTAAGAEPLKYQWYKDEEKLKNGRNYQGSRTNLLTIKATDYDQEGDYYCEVKNDYGITMSEKVQVSLECVEDHDLPVADKPLITSPVNELHTQQQIEDLKTRVGIDDKQIDMQVKDLFVLAKYFDDTTVYLKGLGLLPSQSNDVELMKNHEGTRVAMKFALELWHRKNPYEATFRALMTVALRVGKMEVAERICHHIKSSI